MLPRFCFPAALLLALAPLDARAEHTHQTGFLTNGVTAHRGNSGEFPENTLPAFRSGIALGADWIELDLLRTRDGELVVIHDATTGRVGDIDLAVSESDWTELQRVDVAAGFRQRSGASRQQCPPQRIPRLEDVLRLMMTQHRTRVSIQPKMDCVADAVSMVRELNAEAWVGFNDGNLQYMAEVKRLAPELPVFWDRGPTPDLDQDIPTAVEHGFESLVLHHRGVTMEGVERIRAAGLEVGAWTVNDVPTMKRLLDIGVQRLYTDDPRALIALLADRQFDAVACEGTYPHHLQGVCIGEDAIYWSFTTRLVKSDLAGKPLKQIPVANHHGDLCFHDGKLFVAVNLGQFNRPAGAADSWVYVYDAETLDELARHKTPQVVHGAGGIGYQEGRFLVVGGLPEGVEENYLYEYDESFRLVKRHVLSSGYTRMGIQTATFHQDRWWFGCYGSPPTLLVAGSDLQLLGRHEFDCSLGIEGLPDGRFFVAGGRCRTESGCEGWVQVAVPNPNTGLQIIVSQ